MIHSRQIVIVASKNPVKVNAAQAALKLAFPTRVFDVKGVAAPSGVSDQPMGDDETLKGCRNRAMYCEKNLDPNALVISLEGGCRFHEGDMECFAWAVCRYGSVEGKARTASFTLPPAVAQLVRDGKELGDANDIVFNETNSKQNNGAIGLLTGDIVTRQTYYEHCLLLALVPFMNPNLFPGMLDSALPIKYEFVQIIIEFKLKERTHLRSWIKIVQHFRLLSTKVHIIK